MEYLDKTQVIVNDVVKMVKQIKKAKDTAEISTLERECVKAIQIAQMQFGYVTRDLQAAVNQRRAELREEVNARALSILSPKKEAKKETEDKKASKKKTAKKGK